MTTQAQKIGFIGLGIMGTPMCRHLIAAGHQLFVHTLGKIPLEIAQGSATQCTSQRGVAERAERRQERESDVDTLVGTTGA